MTKSATHRLNWPKLGEVDVEWARDTKKETPFNKYTNEDLVDEKRIDSIGLVVSLGNIVHIGFTPTI